MSQEKPIKLRKIRSPLDRGERTYQILRDAVIHRQFSPRTWITQEQVCQAIGISRTLVRHALARLQSEGLIEARPRKGFRVLEFSDRELTDLFEVREFLETGLFERSARSVTEKELLDIRRNFDRTVDGMNFPESDQELWHARLREYLDVDRGFHDRLIQATDNQQWIKIYYNIRDKIEIMGFQASLMPDQRRRSAEEHFEIIESLLNQDFKLAEEQLRRHIGNVLKSILKARKEAAPDNPDSNPVEK